MEFTKYDKMNVGDEYDNTRNTIGEDIFKKYLNFPKKDNILEIGCGTGNYLKFVDNFKKDTKIVGYDQSTMMLKKCSEKFKQVHNWTNIDALHFISENNNSVSLHNTKISKVPPTNDYIFDLVYSCQVLHHLGGKSGVDDLFQYINHSVSSGTHLIINWVTPEQVLSYWYLQLLPRRIIDIFIEKTIDLTNLSKLAGENGWIFQEVNIHNNEKETLQEYSKYTNPYSVLQSDFRTGDSCWSLLSDEELNVFIDYIKKLDDTSLNNLFNIADIHRKAFGQSTTIVFEKK